MTARAPRLDGKTKLILTAEKLIAKGGIEGASLREIAAAAGQGNHHAVQYHFGSREGLVQAIFAFRMEQMEARRGEMLTAAEAAGRLDDVRTIVEIVFLPQLELPDQHGSHSYAYFLCQYLLRNEGTEFGISARHYRRTSRTRLDCCGVGSTSFPTVSRSGAS